VAEDEVVAVGVRKAPDLEDVAAARLLHREADERARDVAALHLVGAELLDLLLAGARLARARAGGELADELLELRDLLLALRVLLLDAAADLGLRPDHLVVVADVRDDGLVVDVGDVVADGVEEATVVADDDEHARVADE